MADRFSYPRHGEKRPSRKSATTSRRCRKSRKRAWKSRRSRRTCFSRRAGDEVLYRAAERLGMHGAHGAPRRRARASAETSCSMSTAFIKAPKSCGRASTQQRCADTGFSSFRPRTTSRAITTRLRGAAGLPADALPSSARTGSGVVIGSIFTGRYHNSRRSAFPLTSTSCANWRAMKKRFSKSSAASSFRRARCGLGWI